MDESQNYHAKWKKADTKDYITDYSIYMTVLKNKTVGIKLRSVVARGWNGVGEWLQRSTRGLYHVMKTWCDGNILLYVDCGCGHTSIYTCILAYTPKKSEFCYM